MSHANLLIQLILALADCHRIFRLAKMMNHKTGDSLSQTESFDTRRDAFMYWPREIDLGMAAKEPRIQAFHICRIGAGGLHHIWIGNRSLFAATAVGCEHIIPSPNIIGCHLL